VFLYFNNIEFKNLSKLDILNYKGYLRSGNHLKDLDKIREKCVESGFKSIQNGDEALKGPGRPVKNSSGIVAPLNQEYEEDFLSKVYGKVYGSLGILERPLNSRARSEGGLKASSINRMLSALRSYLKFRIEFDLDIPIPPDGIKMVKKEKVTKKVASLEDLVRLIESPMEFEKDERVALRNRCMLEMLFGTGMRISELINLNLDQLNAEGKIYITGKGKKERAVYMTKRSLNWLNKYLKLRLEYAFSEKEKNEKQGDVNKLLTDLGVGEDSNQKDLSNLEVFDSENRKYLKLLERYRKSGFLDKFNSPALFIPFVGIRSKKPNARISTNYFQEKIADYRRRLGIQIPTSAHSLRHGFATYMAENDANPVGLQILLGHESLDTTTKYIHASEKLAEETVRKSHPLQ
jgi:site-specific recombinase XerD